MARKRLPRRTAAFAIVVLAAVALLVAPPAAGRTAEPPYDPSRVLVSFRPGTDAADRAAVHSRLGAHVDNRMDWLQLDVVALPDHVDPLAAVRHYRRSRHVAYAEPNWKVRFASTPDDTLFPQQWPLHNTGQSIAAADPADPAGTPDADMDIPEGWDKAFGPDDLPATGGTRVGVVDTGVDRTHPDLLGKVAACAQSNLGDGQTVEGLCSDEIGHGTHLAGSIAANTDNGLGIAGIAPNASLAVFKMNRGLEALAVDVIAGVRWARTVGEARVISMSFGLEESRALSEEMSQAHDDGVLLVAAAGNQGDGTELFPASHPDVISVGSTDKDDQHESFSNCHSTVELTAPGEAVWSTYVPGSYLAMGGTSTSTPQVAGVAAMIMSSDGLDNVATRRRLQQSADDLGPDGRDPCYGFGRVNLANALRGRPGEPPPRDPDRHHLREVVPFEATNPDGTVLRGHVYLPDTPPGEPVATVLESSPYWGTQSRATDEFALADGTLAGRADWFLAEGYAYAAVNLRGTGRSDGCVDFGGKRDQTDGYQIVEALADQPWSNGKVGMFGLSFSAWSQFMALAEHPPSLKALVPVSGVIDYWSVITRNGAPFLSGPIAYPVFAPLVTTGVLHFGDPQTGPDHLACPNYPTDLAENESIVFNGDRSPYWEERDYRAEIAASDVPVFLVNGILKFRAVNEQGNSEGDGHILQFEDLWERLEPGRRKFLVGQWSHGYPTPNPESTSEQADAWFRPMVLEWFDTYLRDGSSNRRFDEVLYQDTANAWHEARSWPPSGRTAALPLSGETILSPDATPDAGSRMFQSSIHTADRDPSPAGCGPDQVLYVSEPARRTVELAGNFVADLTVSSTLPDGNLTAFLYAVEGDGSCPAESFRELGRALTDLRHWEYTGYGDDFPIQTPTRIKLRSEPFAASLRKGERLVLAVAGDATELFPEVRKPIITVHAGPTDGSTLRLPLVAGALQLGARPADGTMRGPAAADAPGGRRPEAPRRNGLGSLAMTGGDAAAVAAAAAALLAAGWLLVRRPRGVR